MKKAFLLLAVFLLFISGCGVPSNTTGPKWTTKMTLPMIFRVKNSDGTSNTEWRLDGQPNGAGETGADLTGNGSAAYAPGGEISISGGSFGYIEIPAIAPQTTGAIGPGTINLSLLPPLPFTDTTIYGTMAGYSSFKTTNATLKGAEVLNTLTVQINNGGKAGVGGLTVNVTNSVPATCQGIIPQDQTSVNIPITNFELSQGFTITFSGDCVFSTPGTLTVTLSKLQIGTMVVKGSTFATFPNRTIAINQTQTFDMSSLVNGSVYIKNCLLGFRIQNMPGNLKLTTDFIIHGYDATNGSLYNQPVSLVFQNSVQPAPITLPFNKNCSSIQFEMQQITLDPVDTSQDVTIDGSQTLDFKVKPQLTLESEAQELDVSQMDKNMIQDASFKISFTNNTQLSYTINIYLAPTSPPASDPSPVKMTFKIDPSPGGGQAQNTDFTVNLTAADIAYLTGGSKVYNQMEIIDGSQGSVQTSPYPYIEARASASVSLLVNSGNNN